MLHSNLQMGELDMEIMVEMELAQEHLVVVAAEDLEELVQLAQVVMAEMEDQQ
jgi:hypothetical protein